MKVFLEKLPSQIVFFIIVVAIICFYLSSNILSPTVDLAGHYTLVKKIALDGAINTGYVLHLGEMTLYPPGGHILAAGVALILKDPIQSLNVVSLIAFCLCWILIGKTLLQSGILALLIMLGLILGSEWLGARNPWIGLEVADGNYLYGQFISTSFFVCMIYVIGQVLHSSKWRHVLSLLAFALGLNIHASFALVFFAGTCFLFLTQELEKRDLQSVKDLLNFKNLYSSWRVFLYGLIGSAIFVSMPYTKFANAIRRHNGHLGFDYFSTGPTDITNLATIFIIMCLALSSTVLVVHILSRQLRQFYNSNLITTTCFTLGASAIASIQLIMLQLEAVSPYVVKKNFFGMYTLFAMLISVLFVVLVDWCLAKKGDHKPIKKSSTFLGLPMFLFIPLLFFPLLNNHFSNTATPIAKVHAAQKVAEAFHKQSEGTDAYRNTMTQFHEFSMGMNWLISMGELEIDKWGPLSKALVLQKVNEHLPETSFVLANTRNDETMGLKTTSELYRVYTRDEYLRPMSLGPAKKVFLNTTHENPSETQRFLADGFHIPEDWGTWSNDTSSLIRLALDENISEEITLRLLVSPYLPSIRPGFEARVRNGKEILSRKVFNEETVEEWITTIPTQLVGDDGILLLSLDISPSLTEQQIETLVDKRSLGLLVREIELGF